MHLEWITAIKQWISILATTASQHNGCTWTNLDLLGHHLHQYTNSTTQISTNYKFIEMNSNINGFKSMFVIPLDSAMLRPQPEAGRVPPVTLISLILTMRGGHHRHRARRKVQEKKRKKKSHGERPSDIRRKEGEGGEKRRTTTRSLFPSMSPLLPFLTLWRRRKAFDLPRKGKEDENNRKYFYKQQYPILM